jgi:signal peptide peptidase SppA
MENDTTRQWLCGHIWALDLSGLELYAPAFLEQALASGSDPKARPAGDVVTADLPLYGWAEAVLARTRSAPAAPDEPMFRGPVAHLPIFGMLGARPSLLTMIFGGTPLSSLRAALAQAVETPSVRTILLEIDSPGGSVHGTSETWQAIKAADQVKPVTAVVSGTAASAAYWLATAARRIVATPSSDIGGIGVYGVHADKTALYTAKGITHTVIAAGAKKTEGLEVVPLTEEAKAALQRRVDAAYGRFVTEVAAGRKTAPEIVRAGFGEGRVLAAEDALAAGLVDGIQTLEQTVAGFAGVVGDSRRREELAALAGSLKE